MSWEIPLQYDPTFARASSWILNHAANGIRARVPFDRSDFVIDLELRWRKGAWECPDAVYVCPRSPECWATAPTRLHAEMLRCQLVLYGVPASIDYLLRQR